MAPTNGSAPAPADLPVVKQRRPSKRDYLPGKELTPRGELVLSLIAQGLSNQAIAVTMSIGIKSVENYVNDVYSQMGLQRRDRDQHARVMAARIYLYQDSVHLPALVRLAAAWERLNTTRDQYRAALIEWETARRGVEQAMDLSITPTGRDDMPELGDRINGAELGRSIGSTYYWVSCPERSSPQCLGERWSTITTGRYASESPDARRVRLCKACNDHRGRRAWQLRPKQPHTRAM